MRALAAPNGCEHRDRNFRWEDGSYLCWPCFSRKSHEELMESSKFYRGLHEEHMRLKRLNGEGIFGDHDCEHPELDTLETEEHG